MTVRIGHIIIGAVASSVAAVAACGSATAPPEQVTTYTLITINGALLPVQYDTAGRQISTGSITLYGNDSAIISQKVLPPPNAPPPQLTVTQLGWYDVVRSQSQLVFKPRELGFPPDTGTLVLTDIVLRQHQIAPSGFTIETRVYDCGCGILDLVHRAGGGHL
jgi:hypothetical protein